MTTPPAARWFAALGSAAALAFVGPATAGQASPAKPAPSRPQDSFSALAPAPAPRGEVRAMWVVRDTLTSPQKIRNAVALAKKYHFNTLFVQVRGRGDAFYNSRFEPRSEELSDQPADFDPLQLAIDEGHKAGLEVHAWMDTFFVWHRARRPYSPQHVLNQHPDWLVQDQSGHTTTVAQPDCEGAFLDPALPEVREYTKRVFLDVVTRYNVDGIHFDYVRFPCDRFSFSRRDLGLFRDWLAPQLSANDVQYADGKAAHSRLAWYYLYPEQWKTWRRSVVTAAVREIADAAHTAKPGLIVSAAVFANYTVASRDKGQAWHEWLRDGFLDAACPMAYNRSTDLVGRQIRDAVASSSGRPIIGGVGAWQIPAGSAIAKGQLYRALGAGGINLFSYDDVTREGRTEAYLAKIGAHLFNTPTLAPDWHRPVVTAAAAAENPNDSSSSQSRIAGGG